MNYNEVLEVLKTIYKKVNDFAQEDLTIPEDFVFSQEVIEMSQAYKNAWDKVHEHLGYHNRDKRVDSNYQELYDAARALTSPYTLQEKEYLDTFNLGEYKVVDSYGGEGKGETWYKVFHFIQHDVYIRVNGYYTSYDGTDFYDGWGCCSEVKPVTKTITVYQA